MYSSFGWNKERVFLRNLRCRRLPFRPRSSLLAGCMYLSCFIVVATGFLVRTLQLCYDQSCRPCRPSAPRVLHMTSTLFWIHEFGARTRTHITRRVGILIGCPTSDEPACLYFGGFSKMSVQHVPSECCLLPF